MKEELDNEEPMRPWNIPKPLPTISANYDEPNAFHVGIQKVNGLESNSEADSVLAQNCLFRVLSLDEFSHPDLANVGSSLPRETPFSGRISANYAFSNDIGDSKGNFEYLDYPDTTVLVVLTDPFSPSEWSTSVSEVYGCTFSLGSFENFSESSLEPASLVDGKEHGVKTSIATSRSEFNPQYITAGSVIDNYPNASLESHSDISQEDDIGSAALALSPEDKLFWGWFLANGDHELSELVASTVSTSSDKVSEKISNLPIQPEPESEPKSKNIVAVPNSARNIPKRFVSTGPVGVMVSAIQCLSIVLDYRGYQGDIQRIIVNNNITNMAYTSHDPEQQRKLYSHPITENFVHDSNMEFVGFPSRDEVPQISIVSGIIQRKIYIRNISAVVNAVSLILYVELSKFNINLPYEPQIYRYELDSRGSVVNETKCGLCPFCPTVKFLPFKNSSYLSHLTLEHGVYANSFVVPEGLYYGKYAVTRNVDVHKTRTVKAIQCPACFQVVEVSCWKNKANPLLSYFRHFKKKHQNLTKTFMRSNVDPMLYDKQ